MSIAEKAQQIVKEFELTPEQLNACVDHFIWATEHGLRHHTDLGMPMIPTYVTSIPTGKEKGTFLAADLGGTNFRVCSVNLHGDSTYALVHNKWPVPRELMSGSCDDFMAWLTDRVEEFLKEHHSEHYSQENCEWGDHLFKMGFTFSFPVDQTGMNKGTLIRWTKGFDIKDAVGKDICQLFQAAINKKKLPVFVAALVNDTVGTLMSRSYTKAEEGRTLIGCIFGTGTNGAYSEKIKTIPKFDISAHPEITSKIMVINTEWGSFDNRLKYIPNNRFDKELNTHTPNPGYHMFEKRISGMFLGELLRLCLVELQKDGLLFGSSDRIDKTINALETPWSVDSSFPSKIHGDSTSELLGTESIVRQLLGYATTLEQRKAIQAIAKAIGRRGAYLSAVPLAGLILHTKALEKFEGNIDIGADGSVVEFYPQHEEMIREALRWTKIGEQETRVTIGLARDGSGVGAALCALVA